MLRRLLVPALLAIGCDRSSATFELTPAQQAKVSEALSGDRPTPRHPAGVEWDDAVRLLGWDSGNDRPLPGDKFELTLSWQSLRPTGRDWDIVLRLESKVVGAAAVLDHHAVGGLHPIVRWQAGQRIRDRVTVHLPTDFSPGPARLSAGLALRADTHGPIDLGELEIQPPTQIVPLPPARAHWELTDSRTQVWAQWDADGLLFSFHCVDERPWNPLTARDADLWTHDVIELFLDSDVSDPAYVELQVSPSGTLFDAAFDRRRSELALARRWNSGALAHAWIVDDGWRAELAIPWSERLPAPRIGAPIRANIYRLDGDRGRGRTATAWVGPGRGDFHDARRWGRLLLAP